jgi:hypothetical protein
MTTLSSCVSKPNHRVVLEEKSRKVNIEWWWFGHMHKVLEGKCKPKNKIKTSHVHLRYREIEICKG